MSEIEYWKEQIRKGRISRREFMGRAAALGATTALASSMLADIGLAQEPKQGGFARFGLAHGATTDTLDPAIYLDTFPQCAFWGTASNSLTEVDARGDIVPDLAESLEPSDDVKSWVVRLRKGLTFHNGKTVTSTDVVESFRYHMAPDSKSAAKPLLETVTDIKADGPDMVVFTLAAGSADFPYLLSDYHFVIMPAKEGGGAEWESGIRTGPFVLERFDPGISAKFKRNPNYHKTGRPYFDEVEFLAIPDIAARSNALITGEVHFIGRADLKTLDLIRRNPELQILEQTGYGHYVFSMNVTVPPFDNPDVRLALKWAIDRDEIVEKVFFDHGTPGNDNPIAPSIKFATDPQPRFAYDPEKARFHLRKAGMETVKLDLSVADAAFTGAVDAAVLYQERAKAAGIEVNVVREPNDGYWADVWLKKPWYASYWGGRPTCDWLFSQAYAGEAAWNETFWKNPRFNSLLHAARAETDDEKRAAMYGEMQQLIHDDGGVMVLVFNNFVDAHAKTLAHGEVAANWENDGLKIAERWWFA